VVGIDRYKKIEARNHKGAATIIKIMNAQEPLPTAGCGGGTAAGTARGSPTLDWNAILSSHEGWLRRIVCTRLRERQAVDEVMQEVALAAVAQRAPLLDPGRLMGWLYQLAVRQALIYRRKAGRHRALVGRYAQERSTGTEAPESSPLRWLLHNERRDLVQQALRRLPPGDADLLVLKYSEDWSARKLAEQLGVRTVTIETRLHRARRRLRAELADLASEFLTGAENTTNAPA
jgi:RNA polymerase sigma-70 factor (ECF subfamily)